MARQRARCGWAGLKVPNGTHGRDPGTDNAAICTGPSPLTLITSRNLAACPERIPPLRIRAATVFRKLHLHIVHKTWMER